MPPAPSSRTTSYLPRVVRPASEGSRGASEARWPSGTTDPEDIDASTFRARSTPVSASRAKTQGHATGLATPESYKHQGFSPPDSSLPKPGKRRQNASPTIWKRYGNGAPQSSRTTRPPSKPQTKPAPNGSQRSARTSSGVSTAQRISPSESSQISPRSTVDETTRFSA